MIDKETISFQEFRAWLTGLIVGRRGALPDLDDWRQIKVMIDKVEEKEQPLLQPSPVGPYQPSYPQPVTPHPDIYPPCLELSERIFLNCFLSGHFHFLLSFFEARFQAFWILLQLQPGQIH